MSFNLLESARSILSGDMLNKAAGMLGENDSNVQKAISGILPSVFTGVLSKAGSGDTQGIMSMALDAAKNLIPSNLSALIGPGGMSKGMDMLKNLFGEKASAVTNAIAQYSGISGKSASTLMSVAAPVALGTLGKHVMDNNLNAGGIMNLLNSQKDNILNAVPSGLNLASVLGLGSLSTIGSKISNAFSGVSDMAGRQTTKLVSAGEEIKQKTGSRWLLPLLLILVAVALIWYFMNRQSPEEALAPAIDTSNSVTRDTTVAAPVETVYTVKLPDGTVLNAKKGGIEDMLVIFLNDPNSKAGKDIWFNFDQLNFNSGSAELTADSKEQVDNIAKILNAYPKVKIKIGGYADRTGDSVLNQKLSQSRAAATAAAIKAAGTHPEQVTGAEGYGTKFAKYPADAVDSLKQTDRHISVSVRSK